MEPDQIIDKLGGTGKVAELCGVTPGAVSQWRNNGIPKPWLKYLESRFNKVFRDLRQKAAA